MSKKDQAHAHRWQSRVHNWLIMPQTGNTQKLRPVTMDELAKRKVSSGSANKEMWMAINGMVYDVTRFTQFHPGGVLLMQKYSGMDATVVYDKNHTNVPPEDVIGNYRIGPLVPNDHASAAAPAAAAGGADKQKSAAKPSSSSLSVPSAATAQKTTAGGSASSSSAPPPSYATASAISASSGNSLGLPTGKGINPATLRYPPMGSSSSAPRKPYERAPIRNPSAAAGLQEPIEEVISAARNSRLFDAVPDDQLAAAAVASRNNKRAARDARDPSMSHGATHGMPSNAVVAEDEADDQASIECVFDLLDSEGKGSIRLEQLESFLVNIGGFADAKAAREAVKETLASMPSIKTSGRVTKIQFVEIANSL